MAGSQELPICIDDDKEATAKAVGAAEDSANTQVVAVTDVNEDQPAQSDCVSAPAKLTRKQRLEAFNSEFDRILDEFVSNDGDVHDLFSYINQEHKEFYSKVFLI